MHKRISSLLPTKWIFPGLVVEHAKLGLPHGQIKTPGKSLNVLIVGASGSLEGPVHIMRIHVMSCHTDKW